ncbi:MAG: hypothetical protein QME74_01650 [Candidatus Edwardsbacteria bacterium]|nr:hypothetical protein [Candidatus Edwardsbacteria bacterium]
MTATGSSAMKLSSLTLILLLPALILAAQEIPELDDENLSEALAQSLEYFQSHPVNLNHASLDEIASIPLLYPCEALALARYLRRHPGLGDPGLLVRDSVISQETLDLILPYVCLDAPEAKKRPMVELRSSLQRKYPRDNGSVSDPYQGSSLANRQKLIARYGGFVELMTLTQKDAGERSVADFASAGLSYAPRAVVRQAVIGDYQLSYGQGLAFGGTSPKFLSAQCGDRFANGAARLTPNYCADEWSYLRGAALSIEASEGLALTGFASSKKRDGSIDALGNLRAIDISGYHRNRSELNKRGAVTERIGGLRAEYLFSQSLQVGLTGYGVDYGPDFAPPDRIKSGVSIDGTYGFDQGRLFFETAAPLKRRPAAIAGGQVESGALRSYLIVRYYGGGYAGPRTNALESYGGRDERGFTIGSSFRAPFKTTASALYDNFQPLSPAGALARGHGGHFIESVIANQSIPGLRVEWRWRRKQNEDVSSAPLFPFALTRRTASRISVRWEIDRRLSLSAKYEVCRFRRDGSSEAPRGDLLTIGASAGPEKGWRAAAGTTFFAVQSYDARLYGSEPELTGAGSFHPFYGYGRRDALMISYKLRALLSLQVKIARQQRVYKGTDDRQTEAGLSLTFTR